jgi:hypothetical protein
VVPLSPEERSVLDKVSDRELPNGMPSAIAIAGSLLSGTATVAALFQAHW